MTNADFHRLLVAAASDVVRLWYLGRPDDRQRLDCAMDHLREVLAEDPTPALDWNGLVEWSKRSRKEAGSSRPVN
jgi:hypothetical protein